MSQSMQEFVNKFQAAMAQQEEAARANRQHPDRGRSRDGHVEIVFHEGTVRVALQPGAMGLGRKGMEQAVAEAVGELLTSFPRLAEMDDTALDEVTAQLERETAEFQRSLLQRMSEVQSRAESSMPTLRESPKRNAQGT
ncbi:MAG: hypothetical protein L0G99_14635 [Propionibacteriales bacterium]|nr:hypothetical protein [Propionibacteriales bacterium]